MDAEQEALAVTRVRSWLRTGRARDIRRRARLSQADVARALGTSAAQVNRWERGKAVPVRESALRLARLYGELERVIAAEEAAGAVASQVERGVIEVAAGAVTVDTADWG